MKSMRVFDKSNRGTVPKVTLLVNADITFRAFEIGEVINAVYVSRYEVDDTFVEFLFHLAIKILHFRQII